MLHVTNASSAGNLIARSRGEHPLLTIRDELARAESGRRVLEAKLDAVELCGIDGPVLL